MGCTNTKYATYDNKTISPDDLKCELNDNKNNIDIVDNSKKTTTNSTTQTSEIELKRMDIRNKFRYEYNKQNQKIKSK